MNNNYLTLHPYIMKICRLTYKTDHIDVRQTKMASIMYVANITSAPS